MSPPARVHYTEVDDGRARNIAVLVPKSTLNDILSTPIPIFSGRDIFVGRDENTCSIFIHNSIVSRVHFRLYTVIYDEDHMAEYPPLIYCEDRQSSNGTYVNDTLIGTNTSPRSPYLLNDGDVISIRPCWTFRFQQTKQANGRKLDDPQAREIELFKDRYTITDRLLGSGVYGKVFLANDVLTQKQVACKIVDLRKKTLERGSQDTPLDGVQRVEVQAFAEQEKSVTKERKKLIREIEMLSKLSHPNIATLYKAFRTPNSLYIFNELATGGDLYSFLQANGQYLEDLHARIISRQIAIAVEYLHANGIAHRDLKPENILVMRTGIGHRIVLTDFGCAGYIGGTSGRMMSTVGTYDYVAPEVHKPQSRGYTEAIDMWSLGVITLCLLTGEPFLSFEELQDMNQDDIVVKLAQAGRDYPQWSQQGKNFISKLIVLEPLKRMTATEAVNHEWFRKPARIAVELDKLYERSIGFWSKLSNHIGIVEDLPNVLPDVFRPKPLRLSKETIAHRKSIHKKIPDAASPYFGLDRHLQKQGARTKSSLYSQRKKLLEELRETHSPFVDTTRPGRGAVTSIARLKSSIHHQKEDFDTDMSGTTPLVFRPTELSFTVTPIETIATRLKRPAFTLPGKRPIMSNDLEAETGGEHIAMPNSPESKHNRSHNGIFANKTRCRQPSQETGPSMRQVDACDMFGTIPIEIKAAEAAEAEHAAYDDFQSFLDDEDEEMEDFSVQTPVKPLKRSFSLTQDDREMHDEAAKGLPKLSTAKAFSQAIAKKKQLKGSQEDRTSSAVSTNDIR